MYYSLSRGFYTKGVSGAGYNYSNSEKEEKARAIAYNEVLERIEKKPADK